MKRYVFWGLLAALTTLGPQGGRALAQVDSYSNQPGYKEALDFSFSRARLRMQQLGVPADTAKKAVWALRYKPESDCAFLAQEVISSYEGPGSLGEGAILDIERYHLCEPKNLNKHKPQTVRPPYDKNKDPIYQIKLFFRDHYQEAHDMLAKEGVPEEVIKNAATILANGEYHMDSCTADISGMIYDIRDNKDISQDLINLKREGECYISHN